MLAIKSFIRTGELMSDAICVIMCVWHLMVDVLNWIDSLYLVTSVYFYCFIVKLHNRPVYLMSGRIIHSTTMFIWVCFVLFLVDEFLVDRILRCVEKRETEREIWSKYHLSDDIGTILDFVFFYMSVFIRGDHLIDHSKWCNFFSLFFPPSYSWNYVWKTPSFSNN